MNEIELKMFLLANKDYLGEYIKFYRKRAGLSQAKLAKILNTTVYVIEPYELGARIPDEEFRMELYRGLNKYIDDNGIAIIR